MSDFGDYVRRLENAESLIDVMLKRVEDRLDAGDYQTQYADLKEVMRLRGKREGIRLAISYAEERF